MDILAAAFSAIMRFIDVTNAVVTGSQFTDWLKKKLHRSGTGD
jgi:hypothetical protein